MQREGPCKTRRWSEVLPSKSLSSFNKDRFVEIALVKEITSTSYLVQRRRSQQRDCFTKFGIY